MKKKLSTVGKKLEANVKESIINTILSQITNILVFEEQAGMEHENITKLKAEYTEIETKYENAIKEYKALLEEKAKVVNNGVLKKLEHNTTDLTLDDISFPERQKKQLQKLIAILNDKEGALKMGVKIPGAILFYGESDTGRTFTAKILASQTNKKLYHIKEQDIFSGYNVTPNETMNNIIYYIIDKVKEKKEPCVIFIDEVDKIINSMGNEIDARLITNTLLKHINEIGESDLDVVVICSLTKKSSVDPRFINYSQFYDQVYFELPDVEGRRDMIKRHMEKIEKAAKRKIFAEDINLEEIIKKTDHFSPQYIKKLMETNAREAYFRKNSEKKRNVRIDADFIL